MPRASLEECFNEFGEVLEVFIIASQAQNLVAMDWVADLVALASVSLPGFPALFFSWGRDYVSGK